MADRFWVGGTAFWDGTAGTKWALTSGGAGGQAIPTSADDVFFDGASGVVTCTISGGNTGAKSINCTGFTGTLAGTAAISVAGSITLVAGMTYTYTGTITITATASVTSAGKTFDNVTINGTGITVTLADAMTTGIANNTTLTAGTLDLAGFTLSTGIFSSANTNTRAIAFGSSTIALASTTAATTVLSMSTATGFTFTGSGGFTRNQAATATMVFGTTGGTISNAPNLTVNAGASALTISSNSRFRNVNFTGSTCAVSGSVNMAGDLTFASGGTYTALNPTFLVSTTITSTGKTLGNSTINGNGITVTLADAMTTGITNTTTLTAGTLDLAGFTLSTGIFSSANTLTRAIAFGSGNIALTRTTAASTVLSMATATGFTFTGSGGFTRNQAATATVTFGTTGGTTSNAPNLTVNAGASALTIFVNSFFKNVDFTGSTCDVLGSVNMAGNLTLASGGTYTSLVPTFLASGTITSTGKTLGNSTINGTGITVTLADAMTTGITNTTTLTAGTLDLAGFTLSTGIFSSANTNTRAIAFGSSTIALTRTAAAGTVLSMATATGFTFTGSGGFTRNQAATATMVFGTTGGTISNAPNLTVNAGASALTISNNSFFKNLNFTGSTCTVTGILKMAGDLTLASGGTYTGVSPIILASTTFNSNGKQLNALTVNGSGITVTLGDALTVTPNPLLLTEGTLDTANFNVTATSFTSSNSNTRTLNMGSGTWTITGSDWTTSTTTGLTLNPSTSTISMTSTSVKFFSGGGLTYHNLNQGGTGQLTIIGSNTFENITNTVQPATVRFTAGTTQTVSNFGLSGTAGNLITIISTTPGTQATLSKSSGEVNSQFLSIRDSNGTGGAVWTALDSVNVSNNSGWIFPGSNMFMMFI